MKKQLSGKQNFKIFIAGFIPIILAVVVFVLLFFVADLKAQSDDCQRAADGAGNAALNLQWMLEGGVDKLEVLEKRLTDGAADVNKLLADIAGDSGYQNAAVVYNGIIHRADGSTAQDTGVDKYPNCEIGGRLVRISGTEDGILLRMTAGDADLVYVFDEAEIRSAIGRIFKGDYYWSVYNVRTGSYIYNGMPFDSNSYYDALMSVNESGDGEALFASYNAEAYFNELLGKQDGVIAQHMMNISPWGISLVLPESIFADENISADYHFIIIGTVISLQLAMSAGFLAYVFRKRRKMGAELKTVSLTEQKKLEMSVESSGVCVFEYDRSTGSIVDFHDGMADSGVEGRLRPKTIDEFVTYYRPNDEDGLRLYETIKEIKAGDAANIDVHTFANEGERLLRFRLRCLEDTDVIVGSVRDCTLDEFSQIRIKDEEKFLELMRPKAASVWDICVKKNRVKVIYDKRGHTAQRFGIEIGAWMAYEDQFPYRYREHLHPADADQFISNMTLQGLMDMYRSGKTECVRDCRVHSLRKEGYEWHRQMLRVFRDPESKEVMARLFMLNVDAEKNAEMERRERYRIHQQTLTAIGGIYYGLYYIELDNDLCYTAKSHAGELGSEICGPFKTAFAGYIDQYVHADDRENLRRMIEPYMLRKQIQEDKHLLRCEFRRRVGDHFEWSAAIIQAARFENAQIRDVVLAFEDISDIKPFENC